ncbi:hypothetical protein LX15_006155 [Streptoalloteichus tenebrarius]|uniref:DUF4015 domain-containing protein n=1 Tax=Streptoalloteichus tenebrarius (strain ATCC 17920 / DSM 40477 / JCM 4838 / CBS 697.72 / NBRC 16177 / NCIMB 11028 / NRRL B-12390 / A12253. 1 / ISP 5477) TaxID=1933 RepID=A0ABT1I3W4_STRSD|nr:putative glycoside hydrolase [Streptoalloteichus tenebrarius]MCP2262418.1 hypothetical protein [Streptoalloteichus tenebrarius]
MRRPVLRGLRAFGRRSRADGNHDPRPEPSTLGGPPAPDPWEGLDQGRPPTPPAFGRGPVPDPLAGEEPGPAFPRPAPVGVAPAPAAGPWPGRDAARPASAPVFAAASASAPAPTPVPVPGRGPWAGRGSADPPTDPIPVVSPASGPLVGVAGAVGAGTDQPPAPASPPSGEAAPFGMDPLVAEEPESTPPRSVFGEAPVPLPAPDQESWRGNGQDDGSSPPSGVSTLDGKGRRRLRLGLPRLLNRSSSVEPRAGEEGEPPRPRVLTAHRRSDRDRFLMLVAVGVTIASFAATGTVLARSTWSMLTITGLGDAAVVGRDTLAANTVTIGVARPSELDRVQVRLNNQPVETERRGDVLVVKLAGLPEGSYELTARTPGGFVISGEERRRRFVVDTTPPELTLPDRLEVPSPRQAPTVSGQTRGATAVTVQGQQVPLDGDGRFTARLSGPTAAAEVVATDAAGNTSRHEVPVRVVHPGMRGVHVSSGAWASADLRDPVLQMAREKRIDTVELDIKDEAGDVGYLSEVPLAREIGATRDHYDPRKVVEELHGMGLRVVGRIVAFRDPTLGSWAWKNGRSDWLVQNTSGSPWSAHYGEASFTNYANREVRQYNIDLAVEAAKFGFDDILYDYVRRPDGPLEEMSVPGLNGTPEESIASFLAETQRELRPHGAILGASVFGVAATRPKEIAQDIPAMARHADYIAPMTYPSHWGPGEYGVDNPNAQPYEITQRSLADFNKQVENTGVRIIPWLQDFSLGHTYGPEEVSAQIRAAKDNNIDSFLLWNAGCQYHADALSPR